MREKLLLYCAVLTLGIYSCGEDGGLPYDSSGQFIVYSENQFVEAQDSPTTSFSVDADGGSYGIMKKYLEFDALPNEASVRVEEYINYFNFDYPQPTGDIPIALNGEMSMCPWSDSTKLIRIGIQGKTTNHVNLPPANWVFLVDVSGSMGADDKLDLAKEGLLTLVDRLRVEDRVAIVTYSGSSKVALESTLGSEKSDIREAIDKLKAGGHTAGSAGIVNAYNIAEQNFIPDGNNRVLMITDGDFNVGITDTEDLIDLIIEKRNSGIFLSTIGVGIGNFDDGMMEQVANNGNGTYEYLNDLDAAKKIFVNDFGKFYTVAKDVKVQVTFDPSEVEAYRLIGYVNRGITNEGFEDDSEDAGEIGDGQSITAFYEVMPVPNPVSNQKALNVNFKYKLPDGFVSSPLSLDILTADTPIDQASEHQKFGAAVAMFAMMMSNSDFSRNITYDQIIQLAEQGLSYDPNGERASFIESVKKARDL